MVKYSFVCKTKGLRFYDIYHLKLLELNLSEIRVVLSNKVKNQIREAIDKETDRLLHSQLNLSETMTKISKLNALNENIAYANLDSAPSNQTDPLSDIALWVRITDFVAEGLSSQDYHTKPRHKNAHSIFCDCLINAGEDLALGWFREPLVCALQLPKESEVTWRDLPEDQFLPIIDEFCGYFGSSNWGNIVNYTEFGTVATKMVCVAPLYQIDKKTFHTFYLANSIISPTEVTMALYGYEPEEVMESLVAYGFEPLSDFKGNQILRKREDIIHYYAQPKDCAPFLLALKNEGSRLPEHRQKLLKVLAADLFGKSLSEINQTSLRRYQLRNYQV